jgi:hypothetical protein
MADPQDNEAQNETPVSQPQVQVLPATGTQRALFAVVIILGVLIVLALGALVGGFLTGGPAKRAANADKPWNQTLDLPAGTRITSAYLDGNRMVVHLTARDGEDVIILDAATGEELGRLHVKPRE